MVNSQVPADDEENEVQLNENQILAASRDFMNEIQYKKASEIMRAPTTKISKNKNSEQARREVDGVRILEYEMPPGKNQTKNG